MSVKIMDANLKSHFLNLYSMALADTQIETIELELLYNIGAERGIEKRDIEQLILSPDKVKFSIPDSLNEKIEFLFDLARIIWIDGKVDIYEEKALEMFCTKFGFLDENISALSQFLISEVKMSKTKEEIIEIVNQNL